MTSLRATSSVLVALLVGVAGVSAARAQATYVMPDVTAGSSGGAELFLGTANFGTTDATIYTVEPHLNYVLNTRLSVYGRVPIVHGSIDGPADDSFTGLGNVTAGLQYMSPQSTSGTGRLRLGGGGSIALPTSSDENDGGMAAMLGTMLHANDLGRYLPGGTTIAGHGDLRYDAGRLFVQAQGGLDLLFGGDVIGRDDTLALVRLGVASGARLSQRVTLIAELTNLYDVQGDGEFSDDIAHFVDAGVRYQSPTFSVGGRLYLPLDEAFRDQDVLGFGLDAAANF